jgi:hypothetical protein
MANLIFEVKHVKANLEDFYFIIFEASAVLDGLEVDTLESLLFAHLDSKIGTGSVKYPSMNQLAKSTLSTRITRSTLPRCSPFASLPSTETNAKQRTVRPSSKRVVRKGCYSNKARPLKSIEHTRPG